jgi:hypothetical protein
VSGYEISNIIEKDGGIFKSNSFLSTPEELNKKTLSSEELLERFGFDNCNNWNIENLGTKWSFETDDVVDLSDGFFYFRTAWSPPSSFCEFLSEKYQCVVSLEYADCGGGFSGAFTYSKGLYTQGEHKDTIFTPQGLDMLAGDLSDYMEAGAQVLLNFTSDEKDAILNYKRTCKEVFELLSEDKIQNSSNID